MKCNQCGECCWLIVELVSGLDDVPERLTEFVEMDGRDVEVMKRINGRCIALTTDNKCSIYSFRPRECRDFEIGENRCKGKEEL